MPERPVHIVKGPCSGCGEITKGTHRDADGLPYHRTLSGRRCGPITAVAYVRDSGHYPELNTPHPPTIWLTRNTAVHVVQPIGERLALVRVPGMERTRGMGLDCCLVPQEQLSAEPWASIDANEPAAEDEIEMARRWAS